MGRRLSIEATQLRAIRAALKLALEMLPDPDAPVHAWDPSRGPGGALCNRGGKRPKTSDVPVEITCRACQQMPQFGAWRFRRTP